MIAGDELSEATIGFCGDPKMINVLLTRARKVYILCIKFSSISVTHAGDERAAFPRHEALGPDHRHD